MSIDSAFARNQSTSIETQIHNLCKLGRAGSKEDFLNVFTLYGHGGHLGDVTINIFYKFTPLNLWSLHMKFEFTWPSGS